MSGIEGFPRENLERPPLLPPSMERTASRFQTLIAAGIAKASKAEHEISHITAGNIAHVLGRAFGRTSALAEFGRTQEGDYETLRDEYLTLYTDPTTPPQVKEWIDWFGSYLVHRAGIGSGRQFMDRGPAPDLARLLVRTVVSEGGLERSVHAPATLTADGLAHLMKEVTGLVGADADPLWAFLTLPDVNVADPNLMQSFRESYLGEFSGMDAALYGLTELGEWERELKTFAEDRGILTEAVSIDLDVIENQTRDVYDLVESRGTVYAFNR